MKTRIVSNPTPQICEYCGAKYIPAKRGIQKYCSTSCRSVDYKKTPEQKRKKLSSTTRAASESDFKKLEKRVRELENEIKELVNIISKLKWENG
jgi:predicted RNase H-like nuclease (RuvC/YqgF family)